MRDDQGRAARDGRREWSIRGGGSRCKQPWMGRRAIAGQARGEPKRRNVVVRIRPTGDEPVQRPSSGSFSHLVKGSKCRSPRAVPARPSRSLPTLSSWLPPPAWIQRRNAQRGGMGPRNQATRPKRRVCSFVLVVGSCSRCRRRRRRGQVRPGERMEERKSEDGRTAASRIGGDLQARVVSTVGTAQPKIDCTEGGGSNGGVGGGGGSGGVGAQSS